VISFSVRTKRGVHPRNLDKPNQDVFFHHLNFTKNYRKHFFAVCDGHGTNGHLVSNFVKLNLGGNVFMTAAKKKKKINILLLPQ
jgi:serine/threonine protein phosphatase PrpC